MVELLDAVDRELDLAQGDAQAFGGGWLLVDPQGKMKRVLPSEVAAWGSKQLERENAELREIVRDLISGARRSRSIISPRVANIETIETTVTKGQVLEAIRLTKEA